MGTDGNCPVDGKPEFLNGRYKYCYHNKVRLHSYMSFQDIGSMYL